MASRSEDKSPDGFFVGSANQVLDQILLRIDDGQHESAENILRQLIKNRPGHAESWNLRGVNAIKGGGVELAIECFTKASNINSNIVDKFLKSYKQDIMEHQQAQHPNKSIRGVLFSKDLDYLAEYLLWLAFRLNLNFSLKVLFNNVYYLS